VSADLLVLGLEKIRISRGAVGKVKVPKEFARENIAGERF